MATANYYHMFALQPTATDIDIKRRYRQLSFKYHPDHGGSVEKMMLINEAYSVLSNGLLRREYDRRYAMQQATATYSDARPQSYYHMQPAATAEYVRRPAPYQPPQRSYFWVWIGAFVMLLLFGFLAYQLYGIVQLPADTGNDIPVSRAVDSSGRASMRQSRGYYRDTSATSSYE